MFKEYELANVALTMTQREEYLQIWAKQPYYSILQFVLSLADRSRLEGCMYALRSPGSEVFHPQLLMRGGDTNRVNISNFFGKRCPVLSLCRLPCPGRISDALPTLRKPSQAPR